MVGTLHADVVFLGRVLIEGLEQSGERVRTGLGDSVVFPAELRRAEIAREVPCQQRVGVARVPRGEDEQVGVTVEDVDRVLELEVKLLERPQFDAVSLVVRGATVGVGSAVVGPFRPIAHLAQVVTDMDRGAVGAALDDCEISHIRPPRSAVVNSAVRPERSPQHERGEKDAVPRNQNRSIET